jgi:DNA-binding FadR family transcriptional regulator
MQAALQDMRDSADHLESHLASDLRFHRAVLAASHNELLVRLEVVLEPALRARDRLAFEHRHGSGFLEAHTEVFVAVRSGNPDSAEAAMRSLLAMAAADARASLERHRNKRTAPPPAQ